MKILGISAYYHDSAACLLRDGELIAAAQEERFTRKKHDPGFPIHAIRYCLAEAGLQASHLHAVAFYDKPILKFARIMETYLALAPRGLRSFLKAVPVWASQKLWLPAEIQTELDRLGVQRGWELFMPEHHESHASSAFFPSPFQEAAILTVDGVGEWSTSCLGKGKDNEIQLFQETRFPHSLGLLYSAFTYFTGFRVNSGEYKLMGLAPYGEPIYVQRIKEHLIDIKDDGSFHMNMDYFNYLAGLTMTNQAFAKLFDGPPRKPESPITRREAHLARSIQAITEEVVLKMARHAHERTGLSRLCLAGGVALNCVANGLLLREGPFQEIWIQPAAGDAGGAVGAAYFTYFQLQGEERRTDGVHDRMKGALLGPSFSEKQIREFLDAKGYPYERPSDDTWDMKIARLLKEQKVLGLCQGRMEFGPRALGCRSILGDARSESMQSIMNLKVKMRESFRPFAPAVLRERTRDYFDLDCESPYMLLVAQVKEDLIISAQGDETEISIRERVHRKRSEVPAITHVDYSARVQTVNKEIHPAFHRILSAFQELTGCGLVINTSFNQRGEPIVCTPEDAYHCFMRTSMDVLVLGPFFLFKENQPSWSREEASKKGSFELD